MSSQPTSARPFGIFPLVMGAILVLATLAPAVWPEVYRTVAVSHIKPVSGAGFMATLATQYTPASNVISAPAAVNCPDVAAFEVVQQGSVAGNF